MLARADGRVVLVAGAIPGETVRARIERVERGVAFARVEAVLTPSPDRREPFFDAACGGGVYAHVDPARQVALKREVILDGLRRGAGITWEQPLAVAASPERGYRLRARLHVRDGRIGFFKEGTHVLCDAAPSAQLDAATLDVAHRLVDGLGAVFGASSAESLEVSENLDGSERAVHLHPIDRALVGTTLPAPLAARLLVDGLTGLSVATSGGGATTLAGDPTVGDDLARIVRGAPPGIRLRRHAASFFQGNRFLVGGAGAGRRRRRAGRRTGVGSLCRRRPVRRRAVCDRPRSRHGGRGRSGERRRSARQRRGLRRPARRRGPRRRRRAGGDAAAGRRDRHRRSAAHRAVEGGDGGAGRVGRAPDRLRVLRRGDAGPRPQGARRGRLRARVARGLRSLPEHGPRRDAGGAWRVGNDDSGVEFDSGVVQRVALRRGEEAAEQALEAAALPEALGVPLHGDAEARRRALDGFDDAVHRAGRHLQAVARPSSAPDGAGC